MKYRYELPVVQVAHLESIQDVEWLWKVLNDGVLFDRIIFQYADGRQMTFPIEQMSFVDNVEIKSSSHYFFAVNGNGSHYIAWNQSGEAYFIHSDKGFTESLIPEALQKLVYVKDGK